MEGKERLPEKVTGVVNLNSRARRPQEPGRGSSPAGADSEQSHSPRGHPRWHGPGGAGSHCVYRASGWRGLRGQNAGHKGRTESVRANTAPPGPARPKSLVYCLKQGFENVKEMVQPPLRNRQTSARRLVSPRCRGHSKSGVDISKLSQCKWHVKCSAEF